MIQLDPNSKVPEGAVGGCVAIGNFDGMHHGHQTLMKVACDIAHAQSQPCGLVTFEPHPRTVFQPEQPVFRLTPPALKAALVRSLGADFSIAIAFDRDLAAMEAEHFVEHFLVRKLAITHVVSGYDFHFGKGRRGSPQLLQELGAEHGFGVTIVDQVTDDDGTAPYSSSSIRALLHGGQIEQANAQLGYRWVIHGEVVEGDRRGRTIGFPTVNIMLDAGMEPCHGIYAVRVRDLSRDAGTIVNGAAYFGWRPTFDTDRVFLEVYLLDFDGDLYGHDLAVEFVTMVRPDRKFADLDSLVAQMKQDCRDITGILASAGEGQPARPLQPLLAAQLSGELYDNLSKEI